MSPIDKCIVSMERACFLAPGDLRSASRLACVSHPRHALIFAIRERAEIAGKLESYSLRSLGRAFNRHPATCINSIKVARTGNLGEILELARTIAARYIEEA